MVEVAISLMIFLVLILAMIDFSLLVFKWSKGVEASRSVSRYLVVNDPLGDLSGLNGCGSLSSTDEVVFNDGCGSECEGYMSGIIRDFQPEDLSVVYSCSAAGLLERGVDDSSLLLPEITVNLTVRYEFLFSGILGLNNSGQISHVFSVSRTAEDMNTLVVN